MSSNPISFLLLSLLVTTGFAQLQELNENDKLKIVNRHLQYRRSVRASNMKVLKWSNKLQSLASSYIDSCPMVEASLDGRVTDGQYGYNYGTIVYDRETVDSNKNNVNVLIIDQWGGQRRDFQLEKVSDKRVDEWIQIVWANSNKIGCARKACDGDTVVMLCLYSEKADKKSLSPYTLGAACSACPEGFTKCERSLCAPSQEEPEEPKKTFMEDVQSDPEPDVRRGEYVRPAEPNEPEPETPDRRALEPSVAEVGELEKAAADVDPRLRQSETTTTSRACVPILSGTFLILLTQLYQ